MPASQGLPVRPTELNPGALNARTPGTDEGFIERGSNDIEYGAGRGEE
jgi:hypothetical protein